MKIKQAPVIEPPIVTPKMIALAETSSSG